MRWSEYNIYFPARVQESAIPICVRTSKMLLPKPQNSIRNRFALKFNINKYLMHSDFQGAVVSAIEAMQYILDSLDIKKLERYNGDLESISLAKSQFSRTFFNITIENSDSMRSIALRGRSAGLSLLFSLLCSFFDCSPVTIESGQSKPVLFSGDIDGEGRIWPVEGIKEKLNYLIESREFYVLVLPYIKNVDSSHDGFYRCLKDYERILELHHKSVYLYKDIYEVIKYDTFADPFTDIFGHESDIPQHIRSGPPKRVWGYHDSIEYKRNNLSLNST